jgi:hypothetical protein
VDEVEPFDAVDLPDRSHLLDDPLGRLEAIAPAEKVVRRAKRAGKRAPASDLERRRAAILQLGVEVKSRHGQLVQVQHDRSVRVSNDLPSSPERDSRNEVQPAVPGESAQQLGECFFGLASHNEVHKTEGPQRLDIDHRGLRAAQDDGGLRVRVLHLPGDPDGERIRAADRAEPENTARLGLQLAGDKGAKIDPLFRASKILVIQPVQIDDPGYNSALFEHGGQGQDADGGMFRNQTNAFVLCQLPVFQIGCRWGTDQADSAFRRRLRHRCGPARLAYSQWLCSTN